MPGQTASRQHFIVTGGAGFIGSHMVDFLLEKYPESRVTCLDKLSYASEYLLCNLKGAQRYDNFKFERVDLTENPEAVKPVILRDIADFDRVTIYNFAAESCVDLSFLDPLLFTKNNILSTQNLLEAFRHIKNDDFAHFSKISLVHISTDEVYGEQDIGEEVNERACLHPSNPYAATKAACDLIVEAYVKSYKLPVMVLRANNVYGPRQHPEKLIAVTLNRLAHARPNLGLDPENRITLHGDGSHKRRYLHVRDLVRAADLIEMKIRTNGVCGEIYNVGTSDEWTNLEMVKKICVEYMQTAFHHAIDDVSKYFHYGKNRLYNDARYSIDSGKVSELGWRPEISLGQGISEMIKESVHQKKKNSC